MDNLILAIKPEETAEDIIAEICDELSISPNTQAIFGGILKNQLLQLNIADDSIHNAYDPRTFTFLLLAQPVQKGNVQYVQAPLEDYIEVYRPMLAKIVDREFMRYKRLLAKEDMTSILYLTVTKLYSKGYYLHNNLIVRAFRNALNVECRKLKYYVEDASLDAIIGLNDNGDEINLYEVIPDEDATEEAWQMYHYTVADHLESMFEQVKAAMLEEMSLLSFERILIQLKTKSIDARTAKILSKYRNMFSPGLALRSTKNKKKGVK